MTCWALLATALTNCGGGSEDPPESSLPWPAPFYETAYSESEVVDLATALRDGEAAVIPESVRSELLDHVAALGLPTPLDGHLETITIDPETEAEAWIMSGVSAFFQGSLEVAAWSFANAVLADPRDERALSQLGWALLALDRVDDAKGVLLFGAEVEPRLWSLWSNLGHAAVISSEPDRAIYYFGRGLEAHPESIHMHLRRGGLLLERGDVITASAHANHALAIAPDDSDVQDFADEVTEAGGDTTMLPPAPPLPVGSDGMRDVRRDFDDCVEDASRRYSEAMAPFIRSVLMTDQNHRLQRASIDSRYAECRGECPDAACEETCFVVFCAAATGVEVQNFMAHLRVASVDLSYSAAFRTRMRGCAFNAVETHEDRVSEEEIQDFIVYVGWLCEIEAEGARASFREEQADLGDRLPVATGCGSVSAIPPEELTLTFDLESLGISVGMEACLDGFVCIEFGETTIGFSVGVNVASGGITFDYGNPDVIFSIGTGYDAGVGAAGVSLKLSIQNGIGISPGIKIGGVIRSTYSRDFWLISF